MLCYNITLKATEHLFTHGLKMKKKVPKSQNKSWLFSSAIQRLTIVIFIISICYFVLISLL